MHLGKWGNIVFFCNAEKLLMHFKNCSEPDDRIYDYIMGMSKQDTEGEMGEAVQIHAGYVWPMINDQSDHRSYDL